MPAFKSANSRLIYVSIQLKHCRLEPSLSFSLYNFLPKTPIMLMNLFKDDISTSEVE
jgi:hypothetical protein